LMRRRQSIESAQGSANRVEGYENEARRFQSDQTTGGLSTVGPTATDQAFQNALPRSQAQLGQVENNLNQARDYFDAVATGLGRLSNLSEAQVRALQNALARIGDIDRKIQVIESQIRNAPGRG
jgi:hypothetical protein